MIGKKRESRTCSPYIGGSFFCPVTQLSEEVEGEVLAANHKAPATLFLKRLHIWLNPREIESLDSKQTNLVSLKKKTTP